jgi:hypothetical protein
VAVTVLEAVSVELVSVAEVLVTVPVVLDMVADVLVPVAVELETVADVLEAVSVELVSVEEDDADEGSMGLDRGSHPQKPNGAASQSYWVSYSVQCAACMSSQPT